MSELHDPNKAVKFCIRCKCDTERSTNGQCKPCSVIRAAKWRLENPDKAKALRSDWASKHPEKIKASVSKWNLANTEYLKEKRAARYAANPEAEKRKNAAWYEANKEKVSEYGKQWNAENPEAGRLKNNARRARKNASTGSLSKGITKKLFSLQKGKCPCCGEPLGENYHLDHIMPLALGGSNSDDNVQLLRKRCNSQKHAKHPINYMQEKGFLL